MEAVVSEILRHRMQEPGGLKQTAVISIAAHVALMAGIVLVPSIFPARRAAPPVIMNISLGGTPGPRTGGRETIGGRDIRAAELSSDPKLAKPALPTRQPETTMPDPGVKPRTPPKSTAASKDPQGTTAGRGAETRPGSTPVETGARGQGFGLSSGGGGGTGGSFLDVENFCCPQYLTDMVDRIYRNWNQNQPASGIVLMKYTIQRDGGITNIEVERSSQNPFLDRASELALRATRKFAPLPTAFPDNHLTVHLTFEYERRR
jgi:TonB family protein